MIDERDTARPFFYWKDRFGPDGVTVASRREYVQILIPGDKNTDFHTPVNDEHKLRWPDQWKAFQEGTAGIETGRPLKELDFLTAQAIVKLNASNIYTIEHLAGVPDNFVDHIGMGGRTLRQRARDFLKEDPPDYKTLKAESEKMRAELDELRALVEQMTAPSVECDECGQPFKTEAAMKAHRTRMHQRAA